MKQNLVLAAVLFAAIAATGCSSRGNKPLPPPPVVEGDADSSISTSPANNAGTGTASALPATKPNSIGPGYDLSDKVIYFDYDSAEIGTAGQGVISNYGRYLSSKTTAKVRLEGHSDARGSAEYNVALGERRAQTVARELKATGATDAQLSIVSYGKERPAVPGVSEEAFAKNRRVEITQP